MDITAVIGNPQFTMPVAIKQERPDDREINEMAAQIIAANKTKMAQMQQNQSGRPLGMPRASGQQTIQSMFGGNQKNGEIVPDSAAEEEAALDISSVMGRFGWRKLGKELIPHIFRSGEEYCAVRMVENKLLNRYLQYLPQDVYSCTCIRSYFITENEAKLLNEINLRHCEAFYGKEHFTTKDLVVRLTDAGQFNNYLETCYRKICLKTSDPNDRCGFFRINGESVVPYTVKDNVKFVPLFYFEGETDNLKQKAQSVEGWELSYLKFCCKVQGIRNELFASEKCQVVSFLDIKSHFPSNTVFEDWWPQKMPLHQLGAAGVKPNSATMWTPRSQAPTTSNPVSSVMYRQAWSGVSQSVTTSAPTGQRTVTAPSAAMQSTMQQARVSNAPRPPPPLLRASVSSAQQPVRSVNQPINSMVNMVVGQVSNQRPMNSQLRPQISNPRPIQPAPKAPPPHLVPVNGAANHIEEVIDLSSPPASPTRNSRISPYSNLVPIPEAELSTMNTPTPPFRLQKAIISGKYVTCINYKPYSFSNQELLMRVEELGSQFFPDTNVPSMVQALQALGVTVYKLNRLQMRYIAHRDNDIIPVVFAKNVIDYMPQIKYIYNSMNEPAQKRQRIM